MTVHILQQPTVSFKDLLEEWSVPVLDHNKIHVCFANLKAGGDMLGVYEACLPEEEISKAQLFIGGNLRRRYVVSHGILRMLLSAYSGVRPEEIEITVNKLGKPEWPQGDIFFNLSHSGDGCGIAFSRMHEVGLDLEEIRELHDFEEMIQRNFTTEEQRYIDFESKGFQNRFFQMWTIKESYLKATGIGMRLDPRLLDFSMDGDQITLNTVDGKREFDPWEFKILDNKSGFKAALAYHPKQELMTLFNIP